MQLALPRMEAKQDIVNEKIVKRKTSTTATFPSKVRQLNFVFVKISLQFLILKFTTRLHEN